MVKAIIRPPRAEYRLRELGPENFAFGGVDFVREDSQLTNARGLRLECSMWHRARLPEGGAASVYLHGNASCRAEALQVISAVLATGASLFAFDFAGCGQSEGEYISLGWHEQDDVQLALEHLRASGIVTSMALWGRSMGACAAVMHASRDPGVAGIVADSPFASLEQVAMELVQHAPNVVDGAPTVPPFLVRAALRIVAGTVKGRAAFDLYKLRPVDRARTCFTPALFATAHDDVLIRPHHTTSIYEEYAGDKNHVSFEGDHNELRPAFFLDSAAIFLTETLRIPDALALQQTADPVTGRPMNLLDSWARAARGGFGGGSRGALADYDSFGGGGGGGGRRELEAALGMAEMEAEMLRAAIAASLADGAAAPADGDTAAAAPEPEHAEALSPPPAPRGAAAASGAALVRDLLHGTGADSARARGADGERRRGGSARRRRRRGRRAGRAGAGAAAHYASRGGRGAGLRYAIAAAVSTGQCVDLENPEAASKDLLARRERDLGLERVQRPMGLGPPANGFGPPFASRSIWASRNSWRPKSLESDVHSLFLRCLWIP